MQGVADSSSRRIQSVQFPIIPVVRLESVRDVIFGLLTEHSTGIAPKSVSVAWPTGLGDCFRLLDSGIMRDRRRGLVSNVVYRWAVRTCKRLQVDWVLLTFQK